MARRLRPLALATTMIVLAGCQVQRVMTPEPVRTLRIERVARLTDRVATSNAAWSSDGTRIAYAAGEGIFIDALQAEPERKLAAMANATDLGWSADGRTLSVVRAGTLAMVSVRDGAAREVPLDGVAREFRWLPVGDRGMALVETNGRTRLYVVSADGGLRRLVYETEPGFAATDLTWERTGLFAFVRVEDTSGRTTALTRVRFAGPDRVTYSAPGARIAQSAVDPAGQVVASIQGDEHAAQLVVGRLGGGRLRTLAAGRIVAMGWAPQGDKLAFAELGGDAEGRATIWVVDADGGSRLRVSGYQPELGDHPALQVAWSPTGRALAFGTNTGRSAGPVWMARFDRR